MATLVIPDLSGDAGKEFLFLFFKPKFANNSKGTPIGHVDWWLTQIKLHSFAIPAHVIKIDAGLGVTLAL